MLCTILPKQYCTPETTFCQAKKWPKMGGIWGPRKFPGLRELAGLIAEDLEAALEVVLDQLELFR